MKGFIEFQMTNGSNVTIAISSISALEQWPNSQCRLILKEKVEENGLNVVIFPKFDYYFIQGLIKKGLE